MKRLLSLLLAGTLFFSGLAGCNSSNASSTASSNQAQSSGKAASGGQKTIAVVPWDMSQSFASSFAKAAQSKIESYGYKAVILDPAGDWNKCVQILDDLIVKKVDGIIYTAIDTNGASDEVAKVKAAGIPIIDYDCLAAAGNADASVRYDDYKGGEMAAEQVMKALSGKKDATVIAFEEEPSIASSGKRLSGFADYLKKNYPNVKLIKNRSSNRTAEGCYSWATDMITAHPEADAFFCYWGDCTMATYNALQAAGAKNVYVVGYDATIEQQETMKKVGKDCKLYASVGMSPVKMAVKSVDFMKEIFDGSYKRSGPDDIYSFTPELLTVDNAATFNIDK